MIQAVTAQGVVSGANAPSPFEQVSLFRGIPYAAPPVGDRRWAPPEDPEPWEGTRECVTVAPSALQQFHNDWFSREGYVPGFYGTTPPMDEDCLYLNVATAATSPDERLPVYVWFHGGGLTNGFAVDAPTDPSLLASKGIVVVSVAQRLNVFGYLALPQLREEQGKSGNYGFLDQLKAMEWIYANIAQFGGDPANVTVGGQSGGAQKAAALAAVPQSIGRIRRVVSVSGLKWMQPLVAQSVQEERGRTLLRRLGLDPDSTLEELRALDASIFLAPVDRQLLPDDMVTDDVLPYANLREGVERYGCDIDWLSGMVLGETEPFALSAGNPDFVAPSVREPFGSVSELDAHFRSLLGDLAPEEGVSTIAGLDEEDAWDAARVIAGYGLAGSERTNISRNLMLNRLFGRYLDGLGGNGSVYNYLWSHRIPASSTDAGTSRDPRNTLGWHGSDTWFVFGTVRAGISPERPWTRRDHQLADVMSTYVANFVRTGDPNGANLPGWPRANDDFGYIEVIDDVVAHAGCTSAIDVLTRAFVEREYGLEGQIPDSALGSESTGSCR